MQVALVRRPTAQLADGLVTHQERVPIDVDLARQQWLGYVETLERCGWDIRHVDPDEESPDSVFIEDAVVVFDRLAVITRPGASVRRSEIVGAEQSVRDAGLEVVAIEPPACLDGGDILKVGRTAYVGIGGRTDAAAVRQLDAILSPSGWNVVGVPVTKVLHLKSAVTALPDGTIIGYPPLVDDTSVFERFLEVPEPAGSHVVIVGDDRLLMSSDAPNTATLLRELGYDIVTVDISEFEKLEGCVTCLSVRIRA